MSLYGIIFFHSFTSNLHSVVFEVSFLYTAYLQIILFYPLYQICLLNGIFRSFTFKVIVTMLRLKSAVLLSVPSVSVSLFKPYCELFECFLGFHLYLFVAFFFFFKENSTPILGLKLPTPKSRVLCSTASQVPL